MKRLWAKINIIRTIPAMIALCISSEKELIRKDILRWAVAYEKENENLSVWGYLSWFLLYEPQFRNLFYHRLKRGNFLLPVLIKIFYPPMKYLYIYTDSGSIGPGLVIYHGFDTIINAKSIGENCTVYHQVTIGRTTGCPILEDNVQVAAAGIVVGPITIGRNSIIGCNATVTKNVPENCTVVGNPAYIIKRNGIKEKVKL
ncbi:MAG: serine acetyltransferase [Clostridia bacterium]|nr:serine acetyltransferase [Clostridia bacterium]